MNSIESDINSKEVKTSLTEQKGDQHVQKKTKEDLESVLRRLKTNSVENGLCCIEKFDAAEAILSKANEQHYVIVANAVATYYSIFFQGAIEGFYCPLWVDLISQASSVRNITPQISKEIDKLFSLFGLSPIREIVAKFPQSSSFLYGIAEYDLIDQNLDALEGEELRTAIKASIRLHKINYDDLENIINEKNISKEDAYTLRAVLLVQAITSNYEKVIAPLYSQIVNYSSTIDFESLKNDGMIAKTIVLFNATNFLNFVKSSYEASVKDVKTVIELTRKLENRALARHVEGNANFHLADIELKAGNIGAAFDLLIEANLLDCDYHFYHYELARILHDQEDKAAKEYYEKSLMFSHLEMNHINDYGCFLNDFDYKNDLESWEILARDLFQFDEKSL